MHVKAVISSGRSKIRGNELKLRMKVIDRLEHIRQPFVNAVITVGNFDGVHIGHQALFHEVIEKADAIKGTAIAMTFEPHPMRVLKKNNHPPLITLYEQKEELIERSGIDVLICIPFTKKFASLSAEEFIKELLIKKIGMKAIIVGEDYTFGKNREGNLTVLKSYASQLGYEVIVAEWIKGTRNVPDRISSTRVRNLVMTGEIEMARKMLGRHYQIRGLVVKGRDRGGKLLGVPTANLNLQDELCPKTGIYAVRLNTITGFTKAWPISATAPLSMIMNSPLKSISWSLTKIFMIKKYASILLSVSGMKRNLAILPNSKIKLIRTSKSPEKY